MKKMMVVYGTRPEAIKVAPIIKALEGHSDYSVLATVTGQHREMLDQVNSLFRIEPDYDLDLMMPSASLAMMASRALASLGSIIDKERPDAVIVQGDTSTAFVAGLASFYSKVPIVHVEAGLRTFDIASPFPEEGNRQLLSRIAQLHLAPTERAKGNLLAEGIDSSRIVVTGNTVIDALLQTVGHDTDFADPRVREVVQGTDSYVLVTAHRRESWGEPMRDAMRAVRSAALRHPELTWLIPMHRNPIVREVLQDLLGDIRQVVLCEPLDYHEFCHAMKGAFFVLTDSGGVQEEAPSLGKPVLVMRENTERPEASDAGTVRLVGTDRVELEKWILRLVEDPAAHASMANAVNPYGDGKAAERTVAALSHYFEMGEWPEEFKTQ